ncbi:MAG TPA: exodeoxyribonuclease VII small subunit [Sumerlaeia bacterium]|nr:exodeoxyribonuclease VII small subunit [Sumerlaeia bacterium]
MTSSKSFEQNLKNLEEIVEKLEAGNVSLDEAIRLFQKGRALSNACEARLKEIELKIHELVEEEDGRLLAVEAEGTPDNSAPEEGEVE